MPIKLLLLNPEDKLGNGLRAIREKESDLIDISNYEPGVSDPAITTNPGYVIKDNKVYRIIKTYFDLDKGYRVFIAKLDMEGYDVYPVIKEESKEDVKKK